MKPVPLDPVSVLVGASIVGLSLLLIGAAQTVGGGHAIPVRDVRVFGYVPAEQWTYVRVQASNDASGVVNRTFTVPSDRYFVVTDQISNAETLLLVNGVADPDTPMRLEPVRLSSTNDSRCSFEPGTALAFPPASPGEHRFIDFWGYLEPVH